MNLGNKSIKKHFRHLLFNLQHSIFLNKNIGDASFWNMSFHV